MLDKTTPDRYPPAFSLILALLRGDRAAASFADSVDPQAFGIALVQHRIALALPTGALPETLKPIAAERQVRARFAAMNAARALGAVAQAFARAGVPLCAIKGPAFAATFMADATARESIDLDVLVRPGDIGAALACFDTLGYRPEGVEGGSIEHHFARTHALRLRKPEQRVPVELHVRLGEDDRQFPIDAFDPWHFVTEITVANMPVNTLTPEAAIVYAAFHGVKHLFVRLFWLFDIACVMRHPSVDWTAVLALARRLNVELQLAVALELAAQMLAAPMPPALASEARLLRRARPLAAALRLRLDGRALNKRQIVFRFGMLRYLVWLFAIQKDWRARWGTLAIHARVSNEDRSSVTLPRRFSWAYSIVRASRLLRRDG